MARILIIEDDENIRNLIQMALTSVKYEVDAFETAEEALERLKTTKADLAIFDLMLPGMDGLQAIRIIRGEMQLTKLPIIVLTAKDKEYDKVIGLDVGADDYMTKPFGIMELTARVRALLRRTSDLVPESGVFKSGNLVIESATRQVYLGKELVDLTFKEYELLLYLVNNHTRVVSREELLDKIWGYDSEIETRTLDIHIRTLRHKLGTDFEYIKTYRSVGYRFAAELENEAK